MTDGLYLTTWNEQEIQLSYVCKDVYYYIYVKSPEYLGYLSKCSTNGIIFEVSEPISEKRVYLLGYDEHYKKLMEEVENKA